MKKKFLVPIMALAMVVTAGVNYKMISNTASETGMSLSSLFKSAFAQAEGESGVASVSCSDEDGVNSSGEPVTWHQTVCTGTGTLTCECNCGRY